MKIPPFRVFAQPSGLPTTKPMYEPMSLECNLFVDIQTCTYWYWMLCGLTVDLGYTVNGGVEVPVRHHIHLDARKYRLKNRMLGYWDMAKEIFDDELGITTQCFFGLRYPRYVTPPPDDYRVSKEYLEGPPSRPLLWRHSEMPADTRFKLCFRYLERDEDGDFTICTLQEDIPTILGKRRPIISTLQANFLGQTIPFYLSTPYPDEIAAHFDFVRITPEFFEIDPAAPP